MPPNIRHATLENGARDLYFVLDEGNTPEGKPGRFMECVIEWDEEQRDWVLLANDSVIARL